MTRDRKLMGLVVLLIGLPAQGQEAPLDVETILTTPSETAYTESPRCVSTTRIRRTEVLDDRHIIFHLPKDELLLVQFPRSCPMLDRRSALMYEVQGSRLCQLNWVRAVNGAGMSRAIGPLCMIPGFQEVSAEQVALIRRSLDELRRKKRSGQQSPPEKDAPDDSSTDTQPASEPS